MAQNNYIIKLDSPCNEDWDKMNHTKGGKFCTHCQEKVMDFSDLSDSEIVRILERNKGKICGRFNEEQIGRKIVGMKTNTHSLFAKITAAFMFFFLSKDVTAGNELNKNITITNTDNKSDRKFNLSENNIISGFAYSDSTKKPIPNALVMVKANSLVDGVTKENTFIAYTDKTGFFKLIIPDKFSNIKCVLTVSEYDFIFKEVTVEIKKHNDPLKLFLKNRIPTPNNTKMLGMISPIRL